MMKIESPFENTALSKSMIMSVSSLQRNMRCEIQLMFPIVNIPEKKTFSLI